MSAALASKRLAALKMLFVKLTIVILRDKLQLILLESLLKIMRLGRQISLTPGKKCN